MNTVLRIARVAAGLTQAEAARLVNSDAPMLSRWERGRRLIPAKKRRKLLQLYQQRSLFRIGLQLGVNV